MSAEEVATAFVQHYYQAFDSGADALAGLYVSISIPSVGVPVVIYFFLLCSPIIFDG